MLQLSLHGCEFFGERAHPGATALAKREPVPAPNPGFVYLSVSRAMPGFVQLASASEDPQGLTWSLQTFSGVTHFRNVCAVATSDCHGLEERFRSAVGFDQIPHHADLFKLPLRFARQILEEEGHHLPAPADLKPRHPRRWSRPVMIAGWVLMLGLASWVWHPRPETEKPAASLSKSAVTRPPVEATPPRAWSGKPRFRITKM